jgi:peptide/nickel transport system permease protein
MGIGPAPGRMGAFAVSLVATIFGLVLVTFLIGRVVPIDPVIAIVGDHAPEAVVARARAEWGLDRPLYEQFFIYCGNILRGDFGTSVLTGRPVAEDILRVFPATLELATAATLLGVLVGIPAGVLAARYQGTLLDYLIRVLGLAGYSVPVFWLGLVGLLLFYGRWDLVAGPGRIDVYFEGLVPTVTGLMLVDAALAGDWEVWRNALSHLLLPAAVLGYFSVAYLSRMTRTFVLEQLGQHYVYTARLKGAGPGRVVWRHALKGCLVPLLTVIALTYGNLLEGSVLTEIVFAWPGLGLYITNSLLNADMNAVLGGTIVVGIVFVLLNALSDVLYRVLDPRTR